MFIFVLFLFFVLSKVRCFTPNCVPENQFKFYDFPVEACSDFFQNKCKFHPKGYFKTLGDAPLVKIKETAVVPTCAFFNSESLLQIYGANSKIKVLATGAFMNLTNLKAIHLAFNHITEVRSGVFKNISSKSIDLSWNKIVFIDPQAFSEVTDLIYLNLSKNFLATVPINTLSSTLKHLNLAHNLLSRIVLNSKKFLHLTDVDLSNNAISKVAISIEYPVESIDCSNNHLKNFDYLDIESIKVFKMGKNLFEDVPKYLENLNANEIDIYPNPWKCSELFLVWEELLNFDIHLVSKKLDKDSPPECTNRGVLSTLSKTSPKVINCVSDHECPSSMACRANKCWNPCEESACHISSLCLTQEHEFTCSCPSGLLADPLDIQGECKKLDCYVNYHCRTGSICRDGTCITVPDSISTITHRPAGYTYARPSSEFTYPTTHRIPTGGSLSRPSYNHSSPTQHKTNTDAFLSRPSSENFNPFQSGTFKGESYLPPRELFTASTTFKPPKIGVTTEDIPWWFEELPRKEPPKLSRKTK